MMKPHTISFARSPVPTPLGIAVHLGWLSGETSSDGIAIKSLHELHPGERAHSDYTLRNSLRQGGSVPAIWARARQAATRVIGLSWVDESQLLITRPDSGITRVTDLRGRRIGLPARPYEVIDIFRATALRGILNILKSENLALSEVELVDIAAARVPVSDPGQSPAPDARALAPLLWNEYAAECAALLRGEVDAIYVKGAHGLEAAHLIRARTVIDIGFHPDPLLRNNNGTPRPLTVNADVLAQHPDLVAGFLQLVAQAGDWARGHPDETLRYVSEETACAEEWVHLAYGEKLHRHLGLDLHPQSIQALAAFKDFLLEWQFIDQDFDVWDWIDPAPYKQVTARAR
jgi:ABC-type nitrate/sulfonate/bicarbonate transport system substrate-binding protein